MAVTSPALGQRARLATPATRRRRFSAGALPIAAAAGAVGGGDLHLCLRVHRLHLLRLALELEERKAGSDDPPSQSARFTPSFSARPDSRSICAIRVVFTVLFLIMAVLGGLGLAILLDRHIKGSGFFRSVFLFPYALSFITTGVAWRWIFNPETGVNLLIDASGINDVLAAYGAGPLKPGWITDPAVVWQLNGPIAAIFPPAGEWSLKLGVPVAMIPVAIAAAWQLSGFAMAMFLAGLGTISHEVREAAALDGASDWRLYKDIIIPLLNPITVSVLIILTHVSLKIFDLIFAMSGKGPGFATDVPGIFVYEMIFRAQRYNFGAAAAIVMLVAVSIVIVPYLARQLKEL